jgi:hypothetical protein
MPARNFRDLFDAMPDNARKETIHPSCLLETFVNYLTPCQPNAGIG